MMPEFVLNVERRGHMKRVGKRKGQYSRQQKQTKYSDISNDFV